MPEGPSIVILKEAILPFVGQKVLNVRGNSKAGIERINGTVITKIRSFGKQLLITLDSDITIRIHFMLYGSYSINERKDRIERLGLDMEMGEINFYACSVRFLEGDISKMYDWKADVMNDKWSAAAVRKKLQNLKDELACDALLNQDVFAGVGNIIKNEVLFRQKIQPESLIGNIPQRRLNAMIKDARDYSFQFKEWKKEFVLRKNWLVHTKKECPRCKIPIIRKQHLGKTKRRAFYCEKCQKLY